jgi:hypothetical protein
MDEIKKHKRTCSYRPIKNRKYFSKLLRVYFAAKNRCLNKKVYGFKNYGGRGIKFEFDNFVNFYRWAMFSGYRPGLSIDRINNDGNYNYKNCRWATRTQQINNRRNTIRYMGKTIGELHNNYGISKNTLRIRLTKNLSKNRVLHLGRLSSSYVPHKYFGMTMNQLVARSGIKRTTLVMRLKSNPSIKYKDLIKPSDYSIRYKKIREQLRKEGY